MTTSMLPEKCECLRSLAKACSHDREKFEVADALWRQLGEIMPEEIDEQESARKWRYAERCAEAIVQGEPTFPSEEAAYQRDPLFRAFVDILTAELS